MDIVSRLKFFLDSNNISNSQFADSCKIPRPNVSQLLNGRNKKISNDVVQKIHATYPSLSILWLLFGEGAMMENENIQFSEPKIGISETFEPIQPIENEEIHSDLSPDHLVQDFMSEKNISFTHPINIPLSDGKNQDSDSERRQGKENAQASISISQDALKRITNIVVFYNDNSFQSFLPSQF